MSGWKPIKNKPVKAQPILLYFANMEWFDMDGNPATIPDYRDAAERCELGFWDGTTYREAGTGHDCFESWRGDDSLPTHWQPLPKAP